MTRWMTGVERVASDADLRRRLFAGARVGLVTNFTAVTDDYRRCVDALRASDVDVVALLSPEHGMNGAGQAGHGGGMMTDDATGLMVRDVYALDGDALDGVVADCGVDVLACDLQDVGVRFWTYASTMVDCLRSSSRLSIPYVVLDRPNPLGGRVSEGPVLQPGFDSFVGRLRIPLRHGLTLGELARLAAIRDRESGVATLDPVVVDCLWDRSPFPRRSSLWLPPSPNLPTVDTSRVYPGMGLLEGTNCSEGRGTTHPFEQFGAPWVDGRLVRRLRGLGLDGVLFRETFFVPTFGKYEGRPCRGAFVHVTDSESFRPVHVALAVLSALRDLYPDDFRVLPPSAPGRRPAMDLEWGSKDLRRALGSGGDVTGLADDTPSDPRAIYPAGVVVNRVHRPYEKS